MESSMAAGPEGFRQFISFSVGEEEYGMELRRVKEVIRLRETTRLPKSPSFVKGMINLRGEVIPVIDLRGRLGLQACEPTEQTRVIVVQVEDRPLGLVVDLATEVVRIPADQIDPPPVTAGGFSRGLIAGVGKRDDTMVVLLNPDAILSVDEKAAVSSMDEVAAIGSTAP